MSETIWLGTNLERVFVRYAHSAVAHAAAAAAAATAANSQSKSSSSQHPAFLDLSHIRELHSGLKYVLSCAYLRSNDPERAYTILRPVVAALPHSWPMMHLANRILNRMGYPPSPLKALMRLYKACMEHYRRLRTAEAHSSSDSIGLGNSELVFSGLKCFSVPSRAPTARVSGGAGSGLQRGSLFRQRGARSVGPSPV